MRFTVKAETVLNLVLTLLGLSTIIATVLIVPLEVNNNNKYLDVIGDIGIGLFTTGAVGFVLSWMQSRERNRQQHARRKETLRRVDVALYQYLLVICVNATKVNGELKDKPLVEILNAITNHSISIPYSEEEINKLKLLIIMLTEYFEKLDPAMITGDLFTPNENMFHADRIKEGNTILDTCNKNSLSFSNIDTFQRDGFLIHWLSGYKEIPEYKKYLSFVFDGNLLV